MAFEAIGVIQEAPVYVPAIKESYLCLLRIAQGALLGLVGSDVGLRHRERRRAFARLVAGRS